MSSTESPFHNRKNTDSNAIFFILAIFIIIIGAIVPTIFWGIWHKSFGAIPKFWGFSRLCLDMIFGGPYLLSAIFCLVFLFKAEAAKSEYFLFFRNFAPIITTINFLVVTLVASILFSPAVGFIAIIFAAICVGIGYCIWKIAPAVSLLHRWVNPTTTSKDED